MSSTSVVGQQRTMAREAWSILNELANVRLALIKSDCLTEADELEPYMKSFWLYSLFDSSAIVTVAGPQGVGKSLLTNTLLGLSSDEALPVGEGSCEHIPIVLLPQADKESAGFAIACGFNIAAQGEAFLRTTRLSFDEARRRALNPSDDDLVILWHVKNSPPLSRLSPLVVLPGLELNAPWMDAIRFVLDVSDIVIYVVDSARKAQASAAKIEEWIKEVDLATPPVAVVTKTDMMTRAQIESIRSTMSPFDPVFVGQDPEQREAQFQELWKHITRKLAAVPPRTRSRKFKRLLRTTRKVVTSLHAKAKESQREADLEELVIVDRVLRRLEDYWVMSVKPKVLDALDTKLGECRDRAIEAGREHARGITEGFWNRVELWFCGGPSTDSVRKMENAIRNSYLDGLQGRLTGVIEKELEGKLPAGVSQQSVDELRPLISLMLLTPAGSLQKDTVALVESMHQAGQVAEAVAKYIGNVAKGVKTAAEEMGALKGYVMKGKGPQIALAGTLAAGGTATTAMEIAGAGFAGVNASVIAAVTGAAVAAVAAVGLASSIIRSSRDVEWQLENYVRFYAGELEEQTKAQFAKRLEGFWTRMRYEVRQHLAELLGLNDKDRNALALLSSLKRAKDYLDEADASRVV